MTLRLPTSTRDLSASGIVGSRWLTIEQALCCSIHQCKCARRSRCCLACYGCQAPLHGVQVAAPALLRQTFAGTYYVLEANRLGNQHTAFAHLGT